MRPARTKEKAYNYHMDSYQFIDGVYVYFVTFTLTDWLPVFISPEPINIVIESLNFCIEKKFLRVHSFVIMPNHLHLIVSDQNYDNQRLQNALTEFRKYTGNRLAKYIDNALPDSLSIVIRNQAVKDRIRQVWQPGWHAEALATEKFLTQKINYIHENPARKGLVRSATDWLHSSASYWINGEESEVPIAPFEIDH